MRSLNANFITEKNKRGSAPINLLTFNFSTPAYLSDRDVTPSGGNLHSGLIKEWGFIDSSIKQTPGSGVLGSIEICDLQLTIINTESTPFSDNFTSADPPENITVELYQWFAGLLYSEKEIFFKGTIASSLVWDEYECRITVRGIFAKYNKMIGEDLVITLADYPHADPDDIGKMLSLAYGQTKKVPFRALDAGGLTTLADDITAAITTIKLTDSSILEATGTIKIDAEEIAYTGNASNELTGCTRGANGTVAVEHINGAAAWQVQSEYIYGMGCAVKSINTTYAADVRCLAGFTTYTGQTGNEHASYPGKAIIAFDDLPALKKEVRLDIEAETDIARDATNLPIGHALGCRHDGGLLNYDDSTTITFTAAPSGTLSDIYVEYDFEFRQFGMPTGNMHFFLDGVLIAAYNEDDSPAFVQFVSSIEVKKASWPTSATKTKTWRSADGTGIAFAITKAVVNCKATVSEQDQRGKLTSLAATNLPVGKITSESACDTSSTIIFPSAPPGNLSDITITILWERNIWGTARLPSTYRRLEIDGKAVAWETNGGSDYVQFRPNTIKIKKSSWQTSITKTPSFISGFREGEGFVITSAIQSCYTDQFDSSISGNSVADTLIGAVTADIDAIQDDGSGTYTGTPNALIERPDHVLKHLWQSVLSAPSGDIDTITFTSAGTFYSTNAYKFALVISSPILAEDLFMSLALQCRSRFFVSPYGKAKLIVRQLSQASGHSIIKNEIKKDSMSIQRSSTVDLLNLFNLHYDLDHSKETDNPEDCFAVKQFTDATSITRYGQKEWRGTKNMFLFDAITSDAMALDVGTFLMSYHSVIRKMPRFAVFLDNMETEPGDIIDITHPLDSMSSFVCEVLKINHNLGSARQEVIDHIKITGIEN